MTTSPRRASGLEIAALAGAPLAFLVVYLLARPHMPARIPGSFSWVPEWSDPSPPLSLLVIHGLVLLIATAWVFFRLIRNDGSRKSSLRVCAHVLGLWFFSLVGIQAALAPWGADTFSEATDRWWTFFAVFPAQTFMGCVLWSVYMKPSPERTWSSAPASTLTLKPSERVSWSGQATSSWALWSVAGLSLAACALVFVYLPAALLLTVWVVGAAASMRVRVSVDRHGVNVRHALHRSSILLREIASASARYRGRGDTWAPQVPRDVREHVLSGHREVLLLQLRDGSRSAISLDGAAEAADLVNALVARELQGGARYHNTSRRRVDHSITAPNTTT